MDFNKQLQTFKDNYNYIKNIIKGSVKKELIKTGSGGSNNIIVLSNDFIIKVIPNIRNNLLKKKPNNDYLEADIYKKLTDEFIKTNKTPHIVGIFKRYLIEDIKFILPNKCLTFDERLLLPINKINNSIEKLCFLKEGYDKKIVEKKASILILENCNKTISNELVKLLEKKIKLNDKIKLFNDFILRIIFQFMFTLSLIQSKYPDFIHNDMFLRNILAVNEVLNETNDYVQYNLNNKSYYLPANGIYIKINDFGYTLNILKKNSTIENEIKNSIRDSFEIKNNKRDVYTFLLDLYNGANVGGQSIMSIVSNLSKNKNTFIKNLRKVIGKFINYKIIDKINNINPGLLDWEWNISQSKLLMDSIKKPLDYFKKNLFNDYTKLPPDSRIIKIFN